MIFPKIRKLVPGFLNEISGENRLGFAGISRSSPRQHTQFEASVQTAARGRKSTMRRKCKGLRRATAASGETRRLRER
jgi:hypothetical protein